MNRVIISKTYRYCCLSMILSSGSVLANEVSNHSAATNDRFANDGSFIASGYDLSGIGRTVDGNWATRIGDNYFLSANHFHPSVGESVTFHTSNDPFGPSHTYALAGGFAVSGTDLWIGYFDAAIDSSIKTYGYTTTDASSLATSGIANADVFMFGNSVTADTAYGGAGKLTDMVVAQNQAESWLEEGTTEVIAAGESNNFVDPSGWDNVVTFKDESADPAYFFQTYEGQLESGDSGSPLMTFSASELTVQGVAYSVVTENGGLTGNFVDTFGPSPLIDPFEQREASLYTYVGSYESVMNSTIANVPAPVAVPEPGNSSLLVLGLGGLLLRRSRG